MEVLEVMTSKAGISDIEKITLARLRQFCAYGDIYLRVGLRLICELSGGERYDPDYLYNNVSDKINGFTEVLAMPTFVYRALQSYMESGNPAPLENALKRLDGMVWRGEYHPPAKLPQVYLPDALSRLQAIRVGRKGPLLRDIAETHELKECVDKVVAEFKKAASFTPLTTFSDYLGRFVDFIVKKKMSLRDVKNSMENFSNLNFAEQHQKASKGEPAEVFWDLYTFWRRFEAFNVFGIFQVTRDERSTASRGTPLEPVEQVVNSLGMVIFAAGARVSLGGTAGLMRFEAAKSGRPGSKQVHTWACGGLSHMPSGRHSDGGRAPRCSGGAPHVLARHVSPSARPGMRLLNASVALVAAGLAWMSNRPANSSV